jgi:hypothetical protein
MAREKAPRDSARRDYGSKEFMTSAKRMFMVAIASAAIAGCASKSTAPKFFPSGFLDDYEILKPGGEDEPRLLYKNPNVDIPEYEKIFLDRVTIWRGSDRVDEEDEREDSVRIATMLFSAFRKALEVDHVVTDEPGPGVIRFRLALTDVGPESEELVVYSTVLPPPETFSGEREIDEGTRAFLERASVEAEATDSDSGELLRAAVGKRVVELSDDGRIDTWAELDELFVRSATRVSKRVRAARKD